MDPKQTIIENIRIWLSMKGGWVRMVSAAEVVRQARGLCFAASAEAFDTLTGRTWTRLTPQGQLQ